LGISVNSDPLFRPPMMRGMDELLTWSDVAERLAGFERGAQTRLAKLLKVDPSYFSRRLKTRTELTVREQRVVASFFANEPEAEFLSDTAIEAPRRGRLQVFGYAATADRDRIALASDRVLDMLQLPAGLDLDPEEYFVVLPIGSSMEPRIFAGEPQVVRRGYPPARDKKCLIEFNDGTAIIKAYRGERDGRVFAEQYNPAQVVDFDAASVKAIHAIWLSL
jgi:phage repressor protein C with HTH and peptisase S24 domain